MTALIIPGAGAVQVGGQTSTPYNEWPPRENFPAPPLSDKWQRELIQIAGLAPNRLPMLRIEWGSTCTWTPHTRNLKYLSHSQDRQIGWLMDIKDRDGNVVRRKEFAMNVTDTTFRRASEEVGIGEYAGLPYPKMLIREEIGIPRWWISQYMPPSIIGSWDEARGRIKTNIRSDADMGAFPSEGIYYLGFHPIWDHDSARKCCDRAKVERRKCFGYYRPPSELDIDYCALLWRENLREYSHDWTDAPTPEAMQKNMMRLVDKHQDREKKEREEMKLRIRDAYKTHKARFTSRKGRDTWIFTPTGPV